jgi:dolichol-phosphate mannosyltransferase
MKHTVIVTPLANEEATIERQIRQIAALRIPRLEALYVMDDYSKDASRAIIERCAREFPWVYLEYFRESTGVVSCYLRGLQAALSLGAEYVVEMDAGLSHDPARIADFIAGLDAGHDCVFGSRFMPGGGFDGLPWTRRAVSRYGTVLANMILGTRLSDMTSGYEAFRADVLRRLPLDDFLSRRTTHFYQTEMRYYCHRLKSLELPIIFKGSSTTLKPAELLRSLSVLWELKQRKPL